MPAAKFEIKRKCSICGEEFLAKTIESWYCSPRCSKIAWKRRKDEEKRNLRLDEVVKSIPKGQDYIKVSEAYALFGISRDTLYRLIRKKTINHINLGTNQIRVSKAELMKLLGKGNASEGRGESTHASPPSLRSSLSKRLFHISNPRSEFFPSVTPLTGSEI